MTSLLSLLTGTDVVEHAAAQKSAQLLAHTALDSLFSSPDRVPVLLTQRPTFGSSGQLGQLYDARRDRPIHTNVFLRRPEGKEISVTKYDFNVSFLIESMTKQQRLAWYLPSISVGGEELSGEYAEYVDASMSGATDYRMTMYRTTGSQTQGVSVSQLRGLVDPAVLGEDQNATHVITGISYGARLRGDVEVANKGVLSDEEIRSRLRKSLESWGPSPDKDKIEKELRRYEGFKFLAYCDIEMEDGKDSLSRFLKTAKIFDKKVAKTMGVPLVYHLTPIQAVMALVGVYRESPRAYQVSDDATGVLEHYFKEVSWLQLKLHKLFDMCEAGTIKVGKKDLEAIAGKRSSVERALEKLRGEVREEYMRIREGDDGQYALGRFARSIPPDCDAEKLRQFIECYADPGHQAVQFLLLGIVIV